VADYDAVILGAGPGGEVALNTLLKAGRRIALVESNVIGGECSNWGCIPSKTLLRPTELEGKCERAAGVDTPGLEWEDLSAYRDYMVSSHDDSKRVARYEERGVAVFKATGRIDGPGRVTVDGRVLTTEAIVLATGAEAVVPPIPGLAEAGFWTNREATDLTEIPESTVVVGGGPVGIELAQFMARFGTRVTLVQGPSKLADREAPEIGAALAEILQGDGIELRLGVHARSVRLDDGRRTVTLDDGTEARGDVLLLATGRRPRTEGIGLETVGIEPGKRGIPIDDRCRAAERVWAIGDVTGTAAFTHVAKYQGRIAAADILGQEVKADYRAVPRVVFTDPEVAAVGLTGAQAREHGLEVVTATIDLPTSIARPYTFQRNPMGTFGVVVDTSKQVLVGAWAVAPLAGEWIHTAVLAIRAEIPVPVLKDTIAQFPSFSEALGTALRSLPDGPEGQCTIDHCPHPMIQDEDTGLAAARR
jgi:pyruvate/2-oxoglutarate dehydrogenase complex dihydrolipoamide dehydrogenase (E3) component